MKQFFEHIQQSIYGPEYYQNILREQFRYSWKYYTGLALSVALLLTIVASFSLVPLVSRTIHNLPQRLLAYYPDELTLTMVSGKLATNVPEPYYLPLPREFRSELSRGNIDHLAVIDTKTPFSMEQFANYRASVWIGETQMASMDGQGSVKIQMFEQNMSGVFTEDTLRAVLTKAEPYLKFVAPVMAFFIFVGLCMALGMNFVYLLPMALLIMLLGKFLHQRWSFGASYRIGLHAITAPVLLFVLISITPIAHGSLLLYAGIMLIVVYVNFKDAPQQDTVTLPPKAGESEATSS